MSIPDKKYSQIQLQLSAVRGAKQVNHLHGFRVSGFFVCASPDALTASVRGQDADPKRQHFEPGFERK